ncbi:eRF1 methyltransferase catalytic subunit MTQ2 [Fulvia fulva]|uniref:ERF1 methyltransferase catalytic subunit MTQ2 n=1 Tax=Passalora fulva TaxID=5499 RepID=A0A9Q8PJL1_PASFU|nr:eRF1 methyltransferase catalytic subunit MTQ2 [Fulvia fulva]KAK4611715.1 eRF1 methyltransferase catalytic subunit MTQ2 [Fulvia fulva]KAK4612582.1 eRF1 methyltransferase catalytic subunit MTQ2 [Fulvia fulva]UJO23626.1 eRF1 methyltransferase catalytic subunit MTQ2 [Fulvia fulva]WPV20969.1 eRF1 methyltransferase catalytic subunit MTQ2 [Fulvia fulva]WPV36357.1 eRF1 methyltransferase catalytic subunit MTQ2 [Fulvia fulva]
MLPTPSTSHVNYDQIYEPAEDSYLLLDTLSSPSETAFLRNHFPTGTNAPLLLEVGPGSGVVLAFVTANAEHIFGRTDVAAMGADVNMFACRATAQTIKGAILENKSKAGSFLDVISTDLTSSFVAGCVDVLIFNPPYVPTEELPPNPQEAVAGVSLNSHEAFERDSHLLALSYAGGADGMETTNRLLAQLPNVLSKRGIAYVLLCAQNKPKDVAARIGAWPGGWSVVLVGSSGKQAGWEKLCILRIRREQRD